MKVQETRFWESSDQLWEEVKAGSKMVEKSSAAAQKIVQEFHGPYWVGQEQPQDASPENHTWSFITTKVSEMVMNNPRFTVKTRRADLRKKAAEPMRHYLNRWSADHRLARTVERLLTDMLISFGVAKCALEENPGATFPADAIEDEPDAIMWPVPERISPTDYTVDAKARSREEARFQGHRFIRSKLSILQEAADDEDSGWNREAVKNLKTNEGEHRTRGNGTPPREGVHREDVTLWEVWVPEAKMADFDEPEPTDDDGGDDYNGVIVTLADAQDQSGWPRKPRPYYGPPSGPYVLFGAYYVPDEVLPVSPLLAHRVQATALQRLATANMKSAMNYKRFVMVDDTDPNIAEKVQFTEQDGIVIVSGIRRESFIAAEVGGLTPAMVAHQAEARQYLDRVSNMSDASRGNTQSGETATAVAVAESMSAALDDFLKHKLHEAVAELGELAAYLAWTNEEVIAALGEEADADLVPEDVRAAAEAEGSAAIYIYQNSDMEGSFQDNQFEIEPFSMERSSSGVLMRRRLEANAQLMGMLQMAHQHPEWDWKAWITGMLEQFNIPGAGELLDEQILAQVQSLILQSQVAPPPKEAPARMSSELSGSGGQPPAGRQPGQRGSAQGALAGRETGALAGAASQA